jgi:Leucine-rich repeat (LRR) protein
MRIKMKHAGMTAMMLLLCAVFAISLPAQTKTVTKTGQKKPSSTAQKAKPQAQETKASSIPAEQMDVYRQQAEQMVKFYENTLNFLASRTNAVREKEVIINESYLKFFWNDKVQIEDDLDEKRLVPLYKDVQAYLSDVDFFFRRATFTYQVQNVEVKTNIDQQTYFYVTTNRNLSGITVNGDSVNSNKVRYFEINYDDSKKELKIVSVYTTKLNEKEDLRNWWNGLTDEWHGFFGKEMMVQEGVPLGKVSHFNDTVAIVDGMAVPITDSRIYGLFLKVVDSKDLDLSGNASVSDLTPLSKLSSLVSINLSNTAVNDLMPLRNLNSLEVLKCAGTGVSSLDPLKYCTHIREVDISGTPFTDLTTLTSFPGLEVLDISRTKVASLEPLKDMVKMQELRLTGTTVSSLSPVAGMTSLALLDFSGTQVADLTPLKDLKSLVKIWFDKTPVKTLAPLDGLTSLQSVYCDNTKIGNSDAVSYMLGHPGVVVIFATTELTTWWNSMTPEWKKVFSYYVSMDNPPTKEQLHALMTIDSVNIDGRTAITSLEPLVQLPRLSKLIFPNTSVADLTPLKELKQLRVINACNSKVSSLEPLRDHQKLTTLLLDYTAVNDLEPVSALPELELVRADNTGLTLKEGNAFIDKNPSCRFVFQTYENTTWWKALDGAWKDALLKQAGLSGEPDKFGLQAIAGMEKLVIEQNPQISSVQPVLYLSRLKEFRFSDTRVTTLEPLRQMNWVTILGFPKNPIVDLSPIGGLKQLKELDFENTQVEDLQPIMNLPNLEVLKMSGTPVKTLKYISLMKKLTVVDLYNTKISSMDVLDEMPNLKSVKIFNTKISEKKVAAFKLKHPGCEVVYY